MPTVCHFFYLLSRDNYHPTLTEEIHSYRIAAKYGPLCSMEKDDDQ